MGSERRATVDVFPGSAVGDRARLFSALEAAFPVHFRPHSEAGGADGLIAFAPGDQLAARARPPSPVPVFLAADCVSIAADREPVALADEPQLDRRLRGITLQDRLSGRLGTVVDGATVLASTPSRAAWTMSLGPAPVHRVDAVLAELEPDETLWTTLSERPIALLALVQFLRSLSAPFGWRSPPLRATFMFDDPNLRWRSYGFIDYRRLLADADEHSYHAAMAMIPLDAGWAHAPTAALFAQRPDRLSLLVHGNDHVRQELNALRDPARALAVAAQAHRRIGRFERRHGLLVDRVMAPPHGSCSPQMTSALGIVGFDAMCGALPAVEEPRPERPLAMWRPADFVGGCPVIPRIPLSSSSASIALRAFLDHPLVLYGHHQDVAAGLEPLATAAAAVNRLGDVRWVSAGEIACTNVELRVDGERAVARPLARRVRLELAREVRAVRVEAPDDLLDAQGLVGWSLNGGPVLPFGEDEAVAAGQIAWLRLHGRLDVDPRQVAVPAWRPRPKLRRFAVEARDRALPLATAARLMR